MYLALAESAGASSRSSADDEFLQPHLAPAPGRSREVRMVESGRSARLSPRMSVPGHAGGHAGLSTMGRKSGLSRVNQNKFALIAPNPWVICSLVMS